MSGKIALVTGGSRGLGRNMALCLARAGHDVILTYHTNKDAAAAVVASVQAIGRRAIALQLDVGALATFDAFVDQVVAALATSFDCERFDFLISNAGVGHVLPFLKATEQDFDHFCNVHFKGVFFLTQKLLSHMNDGGCLITISSALTRVANPGSSVYASMKAANECFTRYVAKEMGHWQIRANVVASGPVETEFNGALIRNSPALKSRLADMTALGRVGTPEDIGGVVAFLCSEAGGWVNGQRIEVSGGMVL